MMLFYFLFLPVCAFPQHCTWINHHAKETLLQKLSELYPQITFSIHAPIEWNDAHVCNIERSIPPSFHIIFPDQTLKAKLHAANFSANVVFTASMLCVAPKKRILAYQMLSPQDVQNISQSFHSIGQLEQARHYLLNLPEYPLRSRAPLAENQCIVDSFLHRLPQLKQGQSVLLKLRNHFVELQTQAILMGDGYEGKSVSVMVQRPQGRKTFTGILQKDGSVNVEL